MAIAAIEVLATVGLPGWASVFALAKLEVSSAEGKLMEPAKSQA